MGFYITTILHDHQLGIIWSSYDLHFDRIINSVFRFWLIFIKLVQLFASHVCRIFFWYKNICLCNIDHFFHRCCFNKKTLFRATVLAGNNVQLKQMQFVNTACIHATAFNCSNWAQSQGCRNQSSARGYTPKKSSSKKSIEMARTRFCPVWLIAEWKSLPGYRLSSCPAVIHLPLSTTAVLHMYLITLYQLSAAQLWSTFHFISSWPPFVWPSDKE